MFLCSKIGNARARRTHKVHNDNVHLLPLQTDESPPILWQNAPKTCPRFYLFSPAMLSFLFLLTLFLHDAGFVQTLLDHNESARQTLSDSTIPPEQDLAALAHLTDKLARWVPRSFLKDNAGWLEGNITLITKYNEKTPLYRCKMMLNDGTLADVFTPSIPQAWKQGVPMQERTALFGMFIKSYNGIPIFAAPAIQWFPDTWLGNLGFDVASFDQVPVSRITGLEQHDEETNRRMFKFTEADREPFYGLLRVVSETPEGWLEREAACRNALRHYRFIQSSSRNSRQADTFARYGKTHCADTGNGQRSASLVRH